MRDMLAVVCETLHENAELHEIRVKQFLRDETFGKTETSIVVTPLAPSVPNVQGSDKTLNRQFTYQIDVETTSHADSVRLQKIIEDTMKSIRLFALAGGFDEYFSETGRYVVAKRYRGASKLYDIETY